MTAPRPTTTPAAAGAVLGLPGMRFLQPTSAVVAKLLEAGIRAELVEDVGLQLDSGDVAKVAGSRAARERLCIRLAAASPGSCLFGDGGELRTG